MLSDLWMRVRAVVRRERVEGELDEELRFDFERRVEKYIASGMRRGEAMRQARLEFGGLDQVKEECREARGVHLLETLARDVRYGIRALRKSPVFTVVAVLTLALGMGANTAVFSAIDAVLLRPLPFPHGDQLMMVSEYDRKVKGPDLFVAPIRLEEWSRMNSTFQAITGYYTEDESETSGTLPEKMTQALVAPRFLQVWGVSPILGRDFTPEEEHYGGPGAALISYRVWQEHFDGDPRVIGKKLRFGKWALPVVGVMPASFDFPVRNVDFWSPVPPDSPVAQSRESTWYTVIGRLKPGASLEEARANLSTVQRALGKQFPKPDADLGVEVQPLKQTIVGGIRESFWLLFGSVSLLLLIACTNILVLLLARGSQRQHEISVRFSLGASRRTIIRQLLTETFLLVLAGTAAGLVVAGAALKVFQSFAADVPRGSEIHLDGRIALYTFVSAVAATLLCGLLPAIRAVRQGISATLAQTGVAQVSTRNRTQWALVSIQVALAVTLLAGAGLLLRSFQALGQVSPGFNPSYVLTFHITASYAETVNMKGLKQRIDRTIEGLRSLPGIESAATAGALPGIPQKYQMEIKFLEGPADPNRKIIAEGRFVSPGYFATLQIPLVAGKPCSDRLTGMDVVVNRSFANTYLSGAPVIGRHIQLSGQFPLTGEIRGIAGDAREEGLAQEPGPTVYWCDSAPVPDPFYLVRTRTDPAALTETVREKIHALEPSRSVFDSLPLEQRLNATFFENRLRLALLGFFAATAISLACVGLYGTLSYSVAMRRREVGLRLALGALPGQIVKGFMLQGLGVAAIGCIGGLTLTAGFGRVLSGMLYGISATDPATLLAIVLIVFAVSAAASLVPAIRAASVAPMTALRHE
ncbi:MAG TPA: ABC transporter permease [Candidatus Acidoferrales bacterium]|nr:ABC transporter permease [Candidatus Acidoferrales bacterium]